MPADSLGNSLNASRDEIAQQMLKPVSKKNTGSSSTPDMSDLPKMLKDILASNAKTDQKLIQSIGMSNGGEKLTKKAVDGLEALVAGSRPGSFYVSDKKTHELLSQINKKLGGKQGQTVGNTGSPLSAGNLGQALKSQNKSNHLTRRKMNYLIGIEKTYKNLNKSEKQQLRYLDDEIDRLMQVKDSEEDILKIAKQKDKLEAKNELKGKIKQKIIGGVSSELQNAAALTNYQTILDGKRLASALEINSQAAAYAFATKESTENVQQLLRYKTIEAEAGVSVQKYQVLYMKNLKKGMKDSSKAAKIAKTSAKLATVTGMEYGETNETLSDITMQLDLSTNQASQFAREIQFAAEATGVTGDNLLRALTTSKKWITELRNIGDLSAGAAGNLTQMAAALEKRGVGDAGGLTDALKGKRHFTGADAQSRSFSMDIAKRGGLGVQDLKTGILDDKSKMKKYNVGLKSFIASISTMNEFDRDLLLERRGIKGFGWLKQYQKAIEEGTKTQTDLFNDLEKRKNSSLTSADRKIEIEKTQNRLIADAGLSLISSITDTGKGLGNASSVLSEKGNKEYTKLFNQQGISGPVGIAEKTLSSLQKRGKASGVDIDVNKYLTAFKKGGEESKMAMEELNVQVNKIDILEKEAKDPLFKVQNDVNKILGILDSAFGFFTGWGAKVLMVLGMVAGIGGGLGGLRMMGRLFGGGRGAKLAGGAAKGSMLKRGWKGVTNLGGKGAAAGAAKPGFFSAKGPIRRAGGFAGHGGFMANAIGGKGMGGPKSAAKAGGFFSATGPLRRPGGFVGHGGPMAKLTSKGAMTTAAKGAAKGAAKLMTGPFMLLIAAFEGAGRGFDTAANAGEIFNTSLENLTEGQKAAAFSGGFVTGAIDSLTLGLINLVPGGTEALNWLESNFSKGLMIIANTVGEVFGDYIPQVMKDFGNHALSTFSMLTDEVNAQGGLWEGTKNQVSGWWNDPGGMLDKAWLGTKVLFGDDATMKKLEQSKKIIAAKEKGDLANEVSGPKGANYAAIKADIRAEQKRMGITPAAVKAINAGDRDALAKAPTNKPVKVQAVIDGKPEVAATKKEQFNDMHKKVRQDVAGSAVSGSTKAGIGHGRNAIDLMAQNVTSSQLQVALLKEIRDALSGDGSQGQGGPNEDSLTFRPPAKYPTYRARYSDGANSNVMTPTIS